jgi:hypothetical protein
MQEVVRVTDSAENDAHAYRSELLACACGVEMPLTDSGEPSLTFEEWIEYHDDALERALARDAQQYEEEGRWVHPVEPPPPPYIPAGGGSSWVLSPTRVIPPEEGDDQ